MGTTRSVFEILDNHCLLPTALSFTHSPATYSTTPLHSNLVDHPPRQTTRAGAPRWPARASDSSCSGRGIAARLIIDTGQQVAVITPSSGYDRQQGQTIDNKCSPPAARKTKRQSSKLTACFNAEAIPTRVFVKLSSERLCFLRHCWRLTADVTLGFLHLQAI